MANQDHSRAIIASLFSSPAGINAPPAESYVAYCPTWETAPATNGSSQPQLKARFLILSASRDGRLKLHKAKQNNNGTFSIGKTWPLEQLSQVEVGKRMVEGYPAPQPLEFVLTISGKAYRYKTNMPSSQQAAFLVTIVRCWRRFMNGRGQPDLILLGFAVDNPLTPTTATAPSNMSPVMAGQLPSTSRARTPTGPPARGPSPSHPPQQIVGLEMHRPGSAASNVSASSRRPTQAPSPAIPPAPTSQARLYPTSSSPAPASAPAPGPGPTSRASRDGPLSSSYRIDAVPNSNPRLGNPIPPNSSSSSIGPHAGPPVPIQRTPSPSMLNQRRPSSPPRPSPSGVPFTSPFGQPSNGGGGGGLRRPSDQAPPMASAGSRRTSDQAPPMASAGSRRTSDQAPPMASTSSVTAAQASAQKREIHAKIGERKKSIAAQGLQISHSARSASPDQAYASLPPPSSADMMMNGNSSKGTGSGAGNTLDAEGVNAAANANVKKSKTADEVVDDETVLMNVEEMLEGFEWRGGGAGAGSGGDNRGYGGGWDSSAAVRRHGMGRADEIEKRLIGELKALEAASIHAIMQSDDRVNSVVKCLDDTLLELDNMELSMGLYKTQLNLMMDDIAHIESQNRGLQVQTSNQRQLLAEIDNLISTIHISEEDLAALAQESLESPSGIDRLETAAVALYKALVSTRDTDMVAASERIGDYRATAARFSKRILDFLSIMFKFQVDQILHPKDPSLKNPNTLPLHDQLEDFLGRYCGLMLFVKEIEFDRYDEICSTYFSVMSDLYRAEIKELLGAMKTQIRRPTDEELEANFATKDSPTLRQQSIRRAGTLVGNRSPADGARRDKDGKDGKLTASEAFGRALEQIAPHLEREQGFLADFLHVNSIDASITFADYMMLETFFRRGATEHLNQNEGRLKDIKSSMERVFGFLEAELREWIDGVVRADAMQIVGIIAALDRLIMQCEQERIEFLLRLLQRQHVKSTATLERMIKEQTKSIEQTKLTLKKRKGVVPFVRIFPNFVARIELQLESCSDLPIRAVVDEHYERVTATMFDSLQQMAKMDGEASGPDGKDQLNHHVILIENMHHVIAVFSKRQHVLSLDPFVAQAKRVYTKSLDAYIQLVLRRPLARAVDFFGGLEVLLKTTPPNEVTLHSAYTKSAVRRVLSDVRSKDIRKAVEVLYKRVDKHFGVEVSHQAAEHSEVLKTVWKACENELVRISTNWRGLLEKCYPEDKVSLDFSAADITEYFRKAQTA